MCDIEPGESLEAVITVGYVEADKRTKEKMISSFVKKKGKRAEQMLKTDDDIPDWIIQGMEMVEKAPSALNAQPVEFLWKNGKFTAGVNIKNGFEEIDLGIAKLHFELGTQKAGYWELGNGAAFCCL